MQTTINNNTKPGIRIIDKLFGADLLLNSTENTHTVARNLNMVAFVICFAHATYLYFTGIMTKSFVGIFTCYLPATLCVTTEILFRNKKLFIGLIFTFTTVPIAITAKGLYEPLAGLMLFPFTYGIVSFFLLPSPRLIYPVYTLSVTCFTLIDVSYHKKYNQQFSENLSLIIFNDLLFAFLVYTVLGYLRNLLVKFQTQNKAKEQELFSQNMELQTHQEEIASQNFLLQQRNQLLIESWHLQQKITSVLSHDTRTSLIFLKHILLSSKSMTDKNTETQELIYELEREVTSMTNTFESVLEWLKQPSLINNIHKEEILLHDMADEIISSYKGQSKTKGVVLLNQVSSQSVLYMNYEYLKVILRNILGNAIKFSRKGGFVKIWEKETINHFRIYVQDTGVGISAINLKKINEGAGFSTPGTLLETGTGMGLIFCRDFIEKSAGHMEIISTQGVGTTIIITLPRLPGKLVATDRDNIRIGIRY